ncbi:MAG: hypothetical protein RIB47_12960 [Cyclobacteriaceae bacterium]
MKLRILIYLLILTGCDDSGGGLVDTRSPDTFSRISEQSLVELFQIAERNFMTSGGEPGMYSSVQECSTGNFLYINGEHIKLLRTVSMDTEFGTDYFAFDEKSRYAMVVSLTEKATQRFNVSDFRRSGGNDILVYRLRPTGQNDFRIFTVHGLVDSPGEIVDVCESSKGLVISGQVRVSRISSPVSFSFRGRTPR